MLISAPQSIRVGRKRWLYCFLGLLYALLLSPVAGAVDSAELGVLQVYVREGCPHCAEAKKFLPQVVEQRPHLKIVYRSLDREPGARIELIALSQQHGLWPPGVPTFAMHDKVLVGFNDAEISGPALLAFIDDAVTASQTVDAGWFGELSVERLGLPLFTLALGLLDGFNPCAMWVLLFLLSLLIRLQNRRRMALVAGTFVFVSGAVYYAFMAAWLNVFLIMGMSDPVRWTLAGLAILIGAINVKDFFAFKQGLSFSIPEAAKPGLYARMRQLLQNKALAASLLSVTVLAILVNFIELLCTAGLPAIYTAVLSQQGLSMPQYYAYLLLYIVAYIADDTLMVAIAVFTLGSHKLTEQSGRWLKLISGAVMLGLAAAMLLRPDWLI
ncbi:glutaredoxin family protein [Methylomonas methanica]|uniref:Glutaredoxin n=1 Tax=Methylomonas methanica (strain DSM 25384 / MC09) TaxID=857087 RepID=G0A5E3_METMM|nr:glutaredoxin family protein [Methylomonas methanica]AEG01649.1 glutaredoxin [Methylomonas methanica MC09]